MQTTPVQNVALTSAAGAFATVLDPATIAGALTSSARELTATPAIAVNINAIQKATYCVCVKPTAAANTAATFQPRVALYHTATSTKTVRVRSIVISGSASAVAGFTNVEVHRLTATPTGTTVATGYANATANASYVGLDSRDTGGEATVLNTVTAATSAGLLLSQYLGGNSTAATYGGGSSVYDWQEGGELKALTLRAGVLEGIAIGVNSTAATTLTLTVQILFTEE